MFIDIPPELSIHYRTNSVHGNTTSFDPKRQVLVILHPAFLDVSWLDAQFDDPRLSDHYNIIAFDGRCSGKTRSRPSPLHDAWVEAADLAMAFQALNLPPSHILASESAVHSALRFNVLFPELVLSLTLCNVPPSRGKSSLDVYYDLLQLWCYPDDIDAFEQATLQVATHMTGGIMKDPDLLDSVMESLQMNYPPSQRLRTLEMISVALHRTPLTADALAMIRQPVLIIQADSNPSSPTKAAVDLQKKLVNVPKEGAIVYSVKGAEGMVTPFPSTAPIVNRVLSQFLKKQVTSKRWSDTREQFPISRMQSALEELADLMGKPPMRSRDPTSPLSFSCFSSSIVDAQTLVLKQYSKDIAKAFDALNSDGRPLRKFSKRKDADTMHPHDTLSFASTNKVFVPPPRPISPFPQHMSLATSSLSGVTLTPDVLSSHGLATELRNKMKKPGRPSLNLKRPLTSNNSNIDASSSLSKSSLKMKGASKILLSPSMDSSVSTLHF